MNLPPEFFSGGGGGGDGARPSPRKELQGPRPTALKVNKDSYKIRKPPVAPPQHPTPTTEPPPPSRPTATEDRQPVIIYAVSPKVIHTTVSDFMNLVQRLTGNASEDATTTTSSSSSSFAAPAAASGPGDLSPAARLASIEKLSPNKDRETVAIDNGSSPDFFGELFGDTQVELGRAHGILSPAPGSLQPISPGIFSPAPDPFMMGYSNMFIPSPSTLFSAPIVSPSPSSSSLDLFNAFFDF